MTIVPNDHAPAANPLLAFIATKTGLSAALITAAVAVAGPIIAYQKAFQDGKDAYEDALREGTAKLDGKVVQIITDAQKQALQDKAAIEADVLTLQAALDTAQARLDEKDRSHAQALAAVANRAYTPAQRSWRDTDLPPATRLRINAALAAREGGDSGSRLPAADYSGQLAGGEADNPYRVPE